MCTQLVLFETYCPVVSFSRVDCIKLKFSTNYCRLPVTLMHTTVRCHGWNLINLFTPMKWSVNDKFPTDFKGIAHLSSTTHLWFFVTVTKSAPTTWTKTKTTTNQSRVGKAPLPQPNEDERVKGKLWDFVRFTSVNLFSQTKSSFHNSIKCRKGYCCQDC